MLDDKETKHPSFAQLSFNRVTCGGGVGMELYGSDIKHNTVIKMELKSSTKRRGLNHDWYFGEKLIAEVTMSQNQFSELITSMNMGDGIPVTLNFKEGSGRIEAPTFDSKIDTHEEEFKNMTKRVGEELTELKATMEKMLSGSGTIKKVDREEMLARIFRVEQNITSNMPYVENCFKESMDKTVVDAKNTIESWYQHRVTTEGLKALAAEDGVKAPELIESDKG